MKHVTGVIDAHLKKQKTRYLVGDELTYADLAFIPWFINVGKFLLPEWNYTSEFEAFAEWFAELEARESVKRVLALDVFQNH